MDGTFWFAVIWLTAVSIGMVVATIEAWGSTGETYDKVMSIVVDLMLGAFWVLVIVNPS